MSLWENSGSRLMQKTVEILQMLIRTCAAVVPLGMIFQYKG